LSHNKITVGITAYNCHKYLINAIESVINQSVEYWNGIIILDGESDKNTRKLFKDFEHPKFKKFSFKDNQGPYGTRAKAIELSNTDWYFQLDGDDLLPRDSVKNLLQTIQDNPNAEYVYGNCEYFSDTKSIIKNPIMDTDALCFGPLFNAQSPIKLSLFKKIGGFSNDFFINADWDFWLSVYEKNIIGAYSDNILYKRRYRKDNVGSQYAYLRPKIIELIIKKHPKFFSIGDRKNMAWFKYYEQLARSYKARGKRNVAYAYAKKAKEFGEPTSSLETITNEYNMSIFRYYLRRIGRYF
tara:strand:+ start:1297 stop:2190 length:894 start_codon:yes stop_codon:yes gene_type:complete